jgi:SAM-dependent methyltransferase
MLLPRERSSVSAVSAPGGPRGRTPASCTGILGLCRLDVSEPYPDFVARFYDPVYARVRDGVDNEYYLRAMAAAGGPVLEVGVGTGRLFAEARRRGIDAWGVDLSPAMIERCRAKLPQADRERVFVADATRLRSERRFAFIAAPFRVLSHVPDPEDQIRLLDAAHAHLLPGGRFVFDLYVPNLKLLLEGLPPVADFDGEHAPGRRLRRVVSSSPADLARQTNRVRMSFVWDEEDGEHRGDWELEMRFFFRFEIEHLVARSKLTLEAIHGDFAGGPLTPASQEYVVVCRA